MKPEASVTVVSGAKSHGKVSEVGDVAEYVCDEGYALVANRSDGSVLLDSLPATCSVEGTWVFQHTFSCLNETLVLSALASQDSFPWEYLVYLALLMVILLLVTCLFCILLHAHHQRMTRQEENKVTHPRLFESSIASSSTSSTRFLFPDFKAKDLAPVHNGQGVSYDVIEVPEGSLSRGPSLEEEFSGPPENQVEEQPHYQNANMAHEKVIHYPAIGVPLSSFKPNQAAAVQSGPTTRDSLPPQVWSNVPKTSPVHVPTQDAAMNSLPSNWSLKSRPQWRVVAEDIDCDPPKGNNGRANEVATSAPPSMDPLQARLSDDLT